MTSFTDRQLQVLAGVLTAGPVDARQYRSAHLRDVDEMDALEAAHHLVRSDIGGLAVSPLALDELRRRRHPVAERIYALCDRVLAELQRAHRAAPGEALPASRLARSMSLPESQALGALEYLRQASLWRAAADAPPGVVALVVDERVLRFDSLGAVIADQRIKRQRADAAAAGEATGAGRRKDDKFGILDSPRNLEADLKAPCGVLGRAVLFIDIDHFKGVNSALKEVVVDQFVLPPLHELVARCVEGHGHAYKQGGDEIVVLLTNASEMMAAAFAEAVRVRVAQLAFEGEARNTRITVSVGIAQGLLADEGAVLLRRANEAKDAAKEGGRNRLALAVAEGFRILPHST